MAQPPQSPLASFERTLFSRVEDAKRNIEHNYDFIYALATDMHEEWRRWQITIEDTNSGDPGDDAVITFDIVNFTANSIDSTWNDSDYNIVATRLNDFCTAWAAHMNTHLRFTQLRAYRMAWNNEWPGSSPQVKKNPFVKSGAPEFVRAIGASGLAQESQAPQVSLSVTEEVPLRRAWGRFYLPGPATAGMASGTGRFSGTLVDAVALSAFTLYNGLAESEMYPVIPSTYIDKERTAVLQQVTAVRVDDVPDVIRRRRFQHALYRKKHPTPTP